MKKRYIRPESHLFAIDLSENIAKSGNETVVGTLHIQWKDNVGLYTNVPGAIVSSALNDGDYMSEYKNYMGKLDMWALLACLW